jgi:hypothetical protein
MSNRRKLGEVPRPPNPAEVAFRDALRAGCPFCGSKVITGKFRGDIWDYGLMCRPGCRTFTEPHLAHKVASDAARQAGVAAGEPLSYRAVDTSSGTVAGVVLGRG